jgi:hypothetical protein
MILLPLLCWLAWTVAFQRAGRTWLEASIAALVIFGLVAALATEGQSVAGVLTPAGSALAWLLAAAAGLAIARRAGAGTPVAHEVGLKAAFAEIAVVVLFLALTAVVALIAAPNSYDGLSYHLMRVESWIQQGSVAPFATNDIRQLFMPSWAEYNILQLRLLSGNDRFSNLVQWIGLAGCAGGAALLATTLGGGRIAAVAAAALVATLPQAIAQASGTQTDVIAACWAVIAAAFGYRLLRGPGDRWDIALTGIALGLAAATKQTALLAASIALVPAGVLLLLQRERRREGLVCAGAAVLAIALIAGPQLARNHSVFGDLRGHPALVGSLVMEKRSPGVVTANVLRNGAAHFGTPSTPLNEAVATLVARVSRGLGADPDDPATTWSPPFRAVPWSTHEEFASSPLHLLLILACVVAATRRRAPGIRLGFLAALVVGVLVFSALFKWQVYIVRLQTPLIVLALAWAATELEHVPTVGRRALLLLLAIAALPYALLNYTRPLLQLPSQAVTPLPGILTIPRNLQYFNYSPGVGRAYWDVAMHIARSDCIDVGVRAWPDAWLYPVARLARNAGSEARYRHLEVLNVSARFAKPGPAPCLLLQIGPMASQPPAWAETWRLVVEHMGPLGSRGIALYAPNP